MAHIRLFAFVVIVTCSSLPGILGNATFSEHSEHPDSVPVEFTFPLQETINQNNELVTIVTELVEISKSLKERVLKLEQDRHTLDSRIADQDIKMKVLRRSSHRGEKQLRKEVSSMKAKNRLWRKALKKEKRDNELLSQANRQLMEELDVTRRTFNISQAENKYGNIDRLSPGLGFSAFSVSSEHSQQANSSSFVVVTYDHTYLNTGEMNITTGVFTCRVSGVYQFGFSVYVAPEQRAFVRMLRNQNMETGIYSTYGDLVQSQSLLLLLNIDDTVYLDIGMNDGFAIGGNRFTTFHGHLVAQNITISQNEP
ncbi:uncharacterized protein LOC102807705 [Saccoglossus kowalevskii]|uniref:Uncharacterized protein LOC102807705 n=1 Tax=Saccoglossus kowalevskii TaxID=10224 RepID=A0ABM0MS47_SACKO|nr:PREDICTED: uncharacterized protein LOC102807705 [Saccoglossus kowalevskii]